MTYTLHADTKLGQFQLKVSQLERSINFYENILGFQTLSRSDQHAYLSVDGVNPLLILQEVKGAKVTPPNQTAGLYHFAILLPSRKELGLLLKNMIAHQIPLGSGDHGVSEAFYLSDPDQNGIEVYADRPRSQWEIDDHGHYVMTTEAVDVKSMLDVVNDETFKGLPAETVLGHVHLHAHSLPEAVQFYRDVIGFEVVMDVSRMGATFLAAGRYHHHLGLNRWAGPQAPLRTSDAVGLSFYTIVVPTEEELARIQEHFQELNQPFENDQTTLKVVDPNGVNVHFEVQTLAV
ncbi:VOC family protein [Alkalihalobacillus pseudalcaliphilus]|uniref:VOC family protein n=1 Tax=Alkalihalobacillus pseudalcaliphilus TaxID=79884 RepID=UPI00064DD489|nr:VOC family protein [Alkalihalobacillus pseudalcaliphilus]KMK76901.1 glyoxalase [Alkalihalobacillus pseudalcaliphilus]